MSYLARDGLYLRGIPGTSSVEFAAPGGAPNRLRVRFLQVDQQLCKNLCLGSSYLITVEVSGQSYYLNQDLSLSRNHINPMRFSPLVAIDDPYNFQMFPAEFNGKVSQFLIEPNVSPPARALNVRTHNAHTYFLLLFLLIGALSWSKLR